MAGKYPLKINGVDITNMVEIDSYSTAVIPVYGDAVTTMDGVDHVAVIRYKGEVSFAANPLTDTQTVTLCNALMPGVVEVQYHCLQRNAEIIATMRLDRISSQHLGRVRYGGRNWNELPAITLTEL